MHICIFPLNYIAAFIRLLNISYRMCPFYSFLFLYIYADLIVEIFIYRVTNFKRLNVIIVSVSQNFSCNKYGQVEVLSSGFFFPDKMPFGKEERATLYDFSHIFSENALKGSHFNRKIWQTCQVFLKAIQYETVSCNFYDRVIFFKKVLRNSKEMIVA